MWIEVLKTVWPKLLFFILCVTSAFLIMLRAIKKAKKADKDFYDDMKRRYK